MKKRIISMLLALVILLSLVPAMTLEASALMSGYTASTYMQYKEGYNYNVRGRVINSNGTETDVKTTYGDGGYRTYLRSSTTAGGPGTAVSSQGGSITIGGATITVNTDLSFSDDGRYVIVTYTLTSDSSTPQSVDLAVAADVMIHTEDNAPVAANKTDMGIKMETAARAVNNPTKPLYTFDLVTNGLTKATRTWIGAYGGYGGHVFDNGDKETYTSSDSAMAVSWLDRSVSSTTPVTISYKLGVLAESSLSVTTTDQGYTGGAPVNGSISAFVSGGSGINEYGFVKLTGSSHTPTHVNVPTEASDVGHWQTNNTFSVEPGRYRIFYHDTENTTYGSVDAVVYPYTAISYNLNGASGVIPDGSVQRGQTLTLPDAPDYDGYTFVGWKVTAASAGANAVFDAGAPYQAPATNSGNTFSTAYTESGLRETVRLTAQWVKSGTATYDNLGDHPTVSMPSDATVKVGDMLTLQNLGAPARWTFDGWYKNDDRTTLLPGGAVTTILDGDLTGTAPFNVTFHAKWTKDATITFANGDAGTGVNNTAAIYVYPGNTISLPAAPTGTYTDTHSFAGWKITSAPDSAGVNDVYPARGAYTVPSASGAAVTFTAQWVTSGTNAAISLTKAGVTFYSGTTPGATGKSTETIYLTATVKDVGNNPITGGSAVFYDGDTRIGDSTVLDGVGTIPLSGVAAGNHSYTVSYTGVSGTYNGVPKVQVAAVNYLSTDKERPAVSIADAQFTANGFTKTDGKWYKTYDGTALTIAGTVTPPDTTYVNYTNVTPEVTFNGSASAPRDAGSYTVKAAMNDTDDYYAATSESYTVIILPKVITPVISANSKVYDGTESAILSVDWNTLASGAASAAADGKVIHGDSVIASASGQYANANVGTGKSFTISDIYISGGANRDNYKLPDNPTTTGNYETNTVDGATITPALVTFSVSNTTQIYDGSAKEITVVGSSSPSKEWELNAGSGFNVIYKNSDDETLGTEETGGLGKKPVAAGTYTYEITCNDPNFKLADKWEIGETNTYAQTGTITITDGGVADFKFNTASGGADFYANTMHVTYGDPAFTITADSATLFTESVARKITYESDNTDVVTASNAEGSKGQVTIVGVGNAVITAKLEATNYVTTTVQYAVQVAPKAVTVTAVDKSVTYGDAKPTDFSVTYSGFVASDLSGDGPAADVLTGGITYDCAYTANATDGYSNSGSYAITPKGVTAANYDISFVPGTLTVKPKTIYPTITAVERVYDGTTKAEFNVTFPERGGSAQLVNGDQVYAQAVGHFTSAVVKLYNGAVVAQDVTVNSCTLVGAANYVLAANTGSNWTINNARLTPAIVTFVVSNTTHNYDGSEKDIVVTAVATPVKTWARGNDYRVCYTQNSGTATPKDKGNYTYTVTCLDSNYAVEYSGTAPTMTTGGTLTITTNALTDFRFDQDELTNNAKTVTYGEEDFSVTASSDTATDKDSGGAITYSVPANNGVATVDINRGKVTIIGAGTTVVTAIITHANNNYSTATASYVLTVNKKPLTITANAATDVIYGNNYIPAGVTYGAFAYNESVSDLDITGLAYNTAYTPGSAVGRYTYTPYGVTADNYDITYAPGHFNVVKRAVTPVLTAEDKVYDGKDKAAVAVSWAQPAVGDNDTGVFGTDVVEAVVSGAKFDSADVGDPKTVSVTGVTITLGSGNYKLPTEYTKTTTAAITPAAVTYIVNGTTHTYDGSPKEVTVVPVAVPVMPTTGSQYSVTYAVADPGEGQSTTAKLDKDDGTGKPLTKGLYSVTVTTDNPNHTGSATATLEIVANAQPAFAFEAPIVTATYGDTVTLEASTTGTLAIPTAQAITYTSSNPEVATINSSTGVVTILKAGTVTITAKSVVPSYNDATATCALIINKAPLTVTAVGQTKVYGEANSTATPASAVTMTGWMYGETQASNYSATGPAKVTGALAFAYSCEQYSGIGNSYTVTPSGLTSDCYDIIYKTGRISITKRPVFVTITADDKYYDTTAEATLNYTIGAVTEDAASGIVNNDIVEAAAAGTFAQALPGENIKVSVANCQLITGGANYQIESYTDQNVVSGNETITATITATLVDFTALYVPSQYSANIGLTVITVPSIARNLYTVDYYNADPTGKDAAWLKNSANKIGSTHGENTSGTAPVFPGTYYYRAYANDDSGYSGYRIGNYTIENMTQTGHVTNPVITVNVGSSTTNPVIHTNPVLDRTTGKDAYGHAPKFTYVSSDEAVATINNDRTDSIPDGTIHGITLGTVTITVTCEFEGYFTTSWQYSVTVSSTTIDTRLTETVQVENGDTKLAPATVISYTPDDDSGEVTLTRGTGGATTAEALTNDYSIFLRDSRAVGDNDSTYPYIQTALDGNGNVTAGVTKAGHYYIWIRMDSRYAAAGYGDNKVQIGHFYVIPAVPTVGVAGSGRNVEIDYENETMTWDKAVYGVGGVSSAPLSTWTDDVITSNQYRNAVSERPSVYQSPAKLSVGTATQSFAVWMLGGEVNMSTLPGAVENFSVPARPATPASTNVTDPIQINVTTTANSITITKLINYAAPASGVQYAAWPTADKANFSDSTAKWFDTTITGLDATTDYTVFIRVKASNDAASHNFASLGTEVTVVAPATPPSGGGGGSAPTEGGGAATGATPVPPAAINTPDIIEAGTLEGDNKPNSGVGKISGAQGELTVSDDGKTVTITPPRKYRIKDVLADGQSVGAVNTYTFEKVTGSTTFEVIYEWDNPFADVDGDDWFFDAVKQMHITDVVEGTSDTTFSPEMDSLRVMLVTVLGRMSGIKEEDYTKESYRDIQPGSWYAPFVQWATENKIVDGYGNGLFGVEDSLTREQVATLLYRYAHEYMKHDISLIRPNLIESYLDSSKVSTWAYDAMRWCLESGILSGRGNGILDPVGTCSRAELAQFLANFQRYIDSL